MISTRPHGRYVGPALKYFSSEVPARFKGRAEAIQKITRARRPLTEAKRQVQFLRRSGATTKTKPVADLGDQLIFRIPTHRIGDNVPPKPVRVLSPEPDALVFPQLSDVQEIRVRLCPKSGGWDPSDPVYRLINNLETGVAKGGMTVAAFNEAVAQVLLADGHIKKSSPHLR